MNKTILMGRLTKNPDMRHTPSGVAVTNFSLATNEVYYKDGEKQERVEYHNCVSWNRLAEIADEFLSKGSQCLVEGRLQTRSWEKDGIKRYSTEIVVSHLELLGTGGGGSRLKRESKSRHKKPAQEDINAYLPGSGGADQDSIPF